jgi:hypothetical protein
MISCPRRGFEFGVYSERYSSQAKQYPHALLVSAAGAAIIHFIFAFTKGVSVK